MNRSIFALTGALLLAPVVGHTAAQADHRAFPKTAQATAQRYAQWTKASKALQRSQPRLALKEARRTSPEVRQDAGGRYTQWKRLSQRLISTH